MEQKIKPLGDRILVKPDIAGDQKTKSGIIISESTALNEPVYGTVESIGTGIFSQSGDRIPFTVEVGDRVMYKKGMAGEEIKIEGETYLLIREHELLMKISNG